MKRRAFIAALGGVAMAWPLAARAQQPGGMRRIGVLSATTVGDQDNKVRLAGFQQRLQQLGWTDGHNVRIDYRFAAGNPENYAKYAAELVALAPDVILAPGTSLVHLLQATRMVPIVFPFAADPVFGLEIPAAVEKIKALMTERHQVFDQVNELMSRVRLGTGG